MIMMTCRALFLLVLVAVVAGHHPRGGLFGGRFQGVIEPRLGINIHRIIQIEKQIERIRDRLEEAEHVDAERFLGEMDARISALEGSDCEDHEFQCGGDDSHECINDLFVCDGHPDCHNEHDEDDEVCSTAPVQAGHTFVGIMHWTGCMPWEDHVFRFTITSQRRRKAFPSRVLVKARATTDVVTADLEKRHYEQKLRGYYNFANRELNLYLEEGEEAIYDLYIQCHFNSGDDERTDCEVQFEGSQHVCATAEMVVENQEDEDEDDDDHHSSAGRHGYYDTTDHEEKKDDDEDHGDRDRDHDKDDDDRDRKDDDDDKRGND